MELASKAKVICRPGKRNSIFTCNSSRELIIVLECVSIEEHLLPLMIVTKRAYY